MPSSPRPSSVQNPQQAETRPARAPRTIHIDPGYRASIFGDYSRLRVEPTAAPRVDFHPPAQEQEDETDPYYRAHHFK